MKRPVPSLLFATVLLSLALVALAEEPSLLQRTVLASDQRHVMVVAHRGGGFFAPENTLAAIDVGIEAGVDGVELDVQRTGDGHYILMHDETVSRTTTGTGEIAYMTLEAIRDLETRWTPPKFVRKFQFPVPPDSERFKHLKVPTLDEALDRTRGRVFVMLDLKADDSEGVARLVADKGMLGEVIFKVNDIDEGEAVRAVAPDAVLMARPDSEKALDDMLAALDPPIAHLDEKTFIPEVIERLDAAGVLIWMNALGEDDVTSLVADGDDLAWFRRLDDQLESWWPSRYEPHIHPYRKLAERGADLIQTDNLTAAVMAMEKYRKPVRQPGQ